MKKVLIVEDYDLLRVLISKLVKKIQDFEVVGEASDGVTALKIIADIKPDIVTLDLGIPNLGGIEVLEKIKATFPEIKVVVISSNDEALDNIKTMGADAHLLKPFDNKTFQSVLQGL